MWYWILIVVVYNGSGGRADLRMIETDRKEQCIAAGEELKKVHQYWHIRCVGRNGTVVKIGE